MLEVSVSLGLVATGLGEERVETGIKCPLQAWTDERSDWLKELPAFWRRLGFLLSNWG